MLLISTIVCMSRVVHLVQEVEGALGEQQQLLRESALRELELQQKVEALRKVCCCIVLCCAMPPYVFCAVPCCALMCCAVPLMLCCPVLCLSCCAPLCLSCCAVLCLPCCAVLCCAVLCCTVYLLSGLTYFAAQRVLCSNCTNLYCC